MPVPAGLNWTWGQDRKGHTYLDACGGATHRAYGDVGRVRTLQQPIQRDEGRPVRQEPVPLHLPHADAPAPLPALHRLLGDLKKKQQKSCQ